MAILGHLIARSLRLRKKFTLPVAAPITYQRHALRQLLERGQYTAFGKHYGFAEILSREIDFMRAFRERVPVCTYTEMNGALDTGLLTQASHKYLYNLVSARKDELKPSK